MDQPTTEYDLTVEQDVRVPMRDGVELSADIYIPARTQGAGASGSDGPWPALLARGPYGKRGNPGRAQFLARHGYVVMVQDVRGRYQSQGRFFPFVDEPQDGFDTIAWLARHPRCDGQVGMFGGSHLAWVQFHAATQAPPALKTLVPHFGPTSAFHHSMREGGALQLWWFNWIRRLAAYGSQASTKNPGLAEALLGPSMLRWAAQLPWQRGQSPLSLLPEYEEAMFRFMEEDSYNDFWRQPGLGMDEHFGAFPDIPILWIGGWYDFYPHAIADSFTRYAALGRKNQYLLMGPWVHVGLQDTCGDVHYGPSAALSLEHIQLRWFDYWLKGRGESPLSVSPSDRPKPADGRGGAQVFLMGAAEIPPDQLKSPQGHLRHGGKWLQSTAWPPPEAQQQCFYLQGTGALAERVPEEADSSTGYTYDPRDPVPSVGWCYFQDWDGQHVPVGPRDLVQPALLLGRGDVGLPLVARRDVLVFVTAPLAADLRVAGPVEARLWVSSDCTDTDFTARVADIYPPSGAYPAGYALPIAEGILRARFRKSFSHPEPLPAGQAVEVRITLCPTANVFRAGHRLRLDISSSNFPRFEPNRNTWTPGSPARSDRRIRSAENRIHHDREHPSCVSIWVLP
jgi:hypothetical protein